MISVERLAEIGVVAGNKVKFTQEHERYPAGIVKPGETGTITEVNWWGFIVVKLAQYHPGFDEWENELHFNMDAVPEHEAEVLSMQVIEEMPEVG